MSIPIARHKQVRVHSVERLGEIITDIFSTFAIVLGMELSSAFISAPLRLQDKSRQIPPYYYIH